MDNETDVTREQMDATRASMSEKMDTLEQHVVDTVQGAASAVGHTVDDVTDAVHETVQNVKDTFDLPLQATRHPWALVGGSIALGCLGGYLLFRHGAAQSRPSGARQPGIPASRGIAEKPNGVVNAPRFQEIASAKTPVEVAAPTACDQHWLGGVHKRFGPEITKVKGLAIGMVAGVVRDIITQSVPELLKVGLTDVIDGITVKMGGEPIHGPDLKGEAHSPAMENPTVAA